MTVTASAHRHVPLAGFDPFSQHVQRHFKAVTDAYGPLFRVDAGDLYALYLDNLPPEHRQEHTCSCCRTFIERYGSLVAITEDGRTIPVMWSDEEYAFDGNPEVYAASNKAMRRAVAAGKVTDVFLSKDAVWGTPEAGGFTHFAVSNPNVFRSVVDTAGQAMALKREHFGTLMRALAEFPHDHVKQALTLLEAEALYREEKVIGPARFLHHVHTAIIAAPKRGEMKRNVVWRAIASAPAGFCTPRSGMIGTLLEDIAAGLPFEDVKRKFADKMHPLRYQRPQTDASAGNIAQAEALIEKMGLAPALRRRFARLDEVKTIWRPEETKAPEKTTGGVFAGLKPRDARSVEPMDMTPTPITWEKFARTVLPGALSMDLRTIYRMNLGALVTAADPEAPPLFQWDREDERNPVSWYLYNGGSTPSEWGLSPNRWVKVTGITLKPSAWSETNPSEHHGKGAVILLDGARDSRESGLALFPETLRSELHAVRKTIEQFSRTRQIEGREEANACGLIIGDRNDAVVRVRTALGTAAYRIDRWD